MPAAALQIREKSEGPCPLRRKIKEENPTQLITEADDIKTPE